MSLAYSWLLQHNRDLDDNTIWRWLWKLHCPEKIKLMIWLCLRGSLLTNSVRAERGLASSAGCSRCLAPYEDIMHCLRDCPFSKELWVKVGYGASPSFFSLPLLPWLQTFIGQKGHSLFIASIWWAWRWRNNMVFEPQPWPIYRVIRHCFQYCHDLEIVGNKRFLLPCSSEVLITRWCPPPVGKVKVNVDGSVFLNLRQSGVGAVIRDSGGNWLVGCSGRVDAEDITFVELLAIREGLLLAWKFGFRRVVCESDSLEAVDFIQISVVRSHNLDALLHDIRDLLARDWEVVVVHVPRAVNECTDQLARLGAKSASGVQELQTPPNGISSVLLSDAMSL